MHSGKSHFMLTTSDWEACDQCRMSPTCKTHHQDKPRCAHAKPHIRRTLNPQIRKYTPNNLNNHKPVTNNTNDQHPQPPKSPTTKSQTHTTTHSKRKNQTPTPKYPHIHIPTGPNVLTHNPNSEPSKTLHKYTIPAIIKADRKYSFGN